MAEPFDMEGRFNILPIKESIPGGGRSVFNKRELALPGILANLLNAASVPGRAMKGENIGNDELLNLAMNITGGGMGSPKPTGTLLGSGGGRSRTPPIVPLNAHLKRLDDLTRERVQLRQVARDLLTIQDDLKQRGIRVQQGLMKFQQELQGIKGDSAIRFKLGKDRYQVFQEMREESRNIATELRKTAEAYQSAQKRFAYLDQSQGRILDLAHKTGNTQEFFDRLMGNLKNPKNKL
jgi:hypothetical protein